ncbi:MAG TPA: hypothetical protein VN923_06440 [Thermoanaerobaculia bacterium]|nr:hypothetical protein [Thermoanaerobaculia bacterium]
MAAFRNARERRLWLLAAILVGAIYGSAYFVQFLLDALRSRGVLEAAIWSALLVAAAAGLALLVRQRPGRWEVALLLVAAAIYALWLRELRIIQERIHLIEYGALGALAYAALRERWQQAARPPTIESMSAAPPPPPRRRWQRWPTLWAILIAAAAGWGDELVQGLLPNRVYDLRDVATNAEAAALCVLVVAARDRLRSHAARRRLATSLVEPHGDGAAPTAAIE